jgi:integrase
MMPNAKGRRRRFGAVRQLPSGRYQARYPGPDGVVRPADDTFETKTEADVWLTRKEAEILEGDWIDPDAGTVLLRDYAVTWIEERPKLRPKTITSYKSLVRVHITPHFPATTVAELKIGVVRRWRKKLLDNGVGLATTAKAYRLLRAIMNTAVDDGLIRRNPCRIKGAGTEESPERPVLTVRQVYALADAIGFRYRALILLATFASLRWAELAALTPQDIDLTACTVRVTRQIDYPPGGGHTFGPPKSRAGRRSVSFPGLIVPDLRDYLDTLGQDAALLFASPNGQPLRHSNFYRRAWKPARAATGLPGTHFHDLRHTGNQFTADAGANPRELMARMGHDSARAALIYLHSSTERQRDLADKVGKNAQAALRKTAAKPRRSGTRVARNQRNVS